MAVRALVFDVFGTLVDWRSGVADAFRASGVSGDPYELADAWRARYRPILAEVNDGARPWGSFDDLHLVTLDDLLVRARRSSSRRGAARAGGAWHRLDPWPDVRPGLEALRGERPVAMLSNGHVALLVDLARHGDLRFDAVLSAELAQAYKPAPEAYRTAARLLGLQPAELMLVAAHPWDLEGARNAGLKTAFVDRPLEYGPGLGGPATDPDADEAVGDLPELAGAPGGLTIRGGGSPWPTRHTPARLPQSRLRMGPKLDSATSRTHAPRCPATPTPIAPPGDLARRSARPPARVPHHRPTVAERRSQGRSRLGRTSLVSFTEQPERHSSMMIVMKQTATEDEIRAVIDRIESVGARAHPSRATR